MYIYICKHVYIHGFKVKVKLYNTISWGGMQIEYVSVFVLGHNKYVYIYMHAYIYICHVVYKISVSGETV